MESYIPTRPTSDLHRRLSARKRPLAAIETRHHIASEVVGRARQRSSSFSAIGQSLSRLLPSNRKEKGGTLRQHEDDSKVVNDPESLISFMEDFGKRGRSTEIEDEGDTTRRTKSWSPKKVPRVVDEMDDKSITLSKLKKPSTLKRLWELHKSLELDNRADNFSRHPDHLRSEARKPCRAEDKRRADDVSEQKNLVQQSSLVRLGIQEPELTPQRSRQILEEKRARREERRSFRESDDFLGIQGANPRTGYPDASTATSSSAEDVMSETTRQKLEEDEKRMQSASREYKEALERRETELRRLEVKRERRSREKKERVEKKRMELRARMRKEGRWRNESHRWSMVTEPELSPILQSTTGSPTRETVPANHVPVRCLTVNEDSIPNLTANVEEGYFNRATSPLKAPKALQRYIKPYAASTPDTPRRPGEPIQSVEYPSRSPLHSRLPVSSGSAYGSRSGGRTQAPQHISLPIQQKEIGSPVVRGRANSSETVVHNFKADEPVAVELEDSPGLEVATTPPVTTPRLNVTTPGETIHNIPLRSPTAYDQHFLDILTTPEFGGLQENEATATSYQSASTNQALYPLQLLQSPKNILRANRIPSLEEFPPVVLKDPISARIPSTPRHQEIPIPSPTFNQEELWSHESNIITHIITTTGFVDPQCPLSQFDGSKDASEAQVSPQGLILANGRIPTPNFRLKAMPNGMPNTGSQMDQADIATSSAHHPPAFTTPIKRPIPGLYQPTSLKLEKVATKTTPTSISTSPQRQSPSQQYAVAQKAARVAFSNMSPQRQAEVKARSTSLISPKPRTMEIRERSGQGRKAFSVGNVDIGDLSRAGEELERNPQLLRKRIEQAKKPGEPSRNGEEDGLIAWCTEAVEKVRIADEKASPGKKSTHRSPNKNVKGTQSSSSKISKGPDKSIANISLLWRTYGMVKQAVHTALLFVSPVFNPSSSLRWRWERNELTWQDVLLIGAAGVFGGGAFVIMVLCARLLGVGLQIVKVCIKVCKMLAGL